MNIKILELSTGWSSNVINVCEMFTAHVGVQLGSGIKDHFDVEVYSGDIIGCVYNETFDNDAPLFVSYLEVYFEDGCFWVDDSFKKDRSSRTPLNECDHFYVVGNILNSKDKLALVDQKYKGPITVN